MSKGYDNDKNINSSICQLNDSLVKVEEGSSEENRFNAKK